jgi:PAS domain S-box-containing protein
VHTHDNLSDQTLLAAILESASDYAIIALTANNRIIFWNPGAEKLLGWSAEEALDQQGDIIFTPEDREAGAVEAEINAASAFGRAEDERWHVRKDRARFWGSGLLMPLKNGAGFLKIMRDQTQRREAEIALAESEERFRALANHIPQLVFRSASMGRRTWGSPQWVTFTGLAEENSLGLGWMDAVHPDDHDLTLNAWAEAEVRNELYVEHRIRRSIDGQYRWFQTRAKRLDNEWFGTSTDIDDLRRLKERQDVLLRELQHRTGNLLAVIASIARRTAQSSDTIQNFTERFEARIQALSRVQGQITRNNAASVELEDLVTMELEAMGLLETGKVTIEGPTCTLNPTQAETLALALHELATNAVKHGAMSSGQGNLTVRWTCPSNGERWLEWLETGVSKSGPITTKRGYGRELIEVALPYALGAQTRLDLDANGTVRCSIGLPRSGSSSGGGAL